MIGVITTGSNFRSLLKYLLKKEQKATILLKKAYSSTAATIASEFNRIAQKRPSTQKPVKHISIGFAPADGVIDRYTKKALATEIVNQLGYTNNQWVLIEHGRDRPGRKKHNHDHVHIVINMVTYSGRRIRDSFDKTRLERILRQLEHKYGLTKVISSDKRQFRRPKKDRYQKFNREYAAWKQEQQTNPQAQPPQEPEIQTLEAIIKTAIADRPTFSTYLARLQQLGYKVEMFKTKKGRKRLKYYLKSSDRAVTRITGGSLNQLRQAGVDVNFKRDQPNLDRMQQGEVIPLTTQQALKWDDIQANRYQWLPKSKQTEMRTYDQLKRKKTQDNLEKTSQKLDVER